MKPRAFRSIALFMAVAVIAAVASFAQPGPSVEAINRAPGSMSIELNPSDRFVRPSDNEIEVTITLSNLRVGAPYYLDVGVYSAEGYVRGCNGDGMKQRHNFRRVTTSTITRTAKVSLSPQLCLWRLLREGLPLGLVEQLQCSFYDPWVQRSGQYGGSGGPRRL